MSRTTTTTSTLSPINAYIQRKGLSVAQPLCVHANFGEPYTIPAKNSKTMKFRRYERIAPLDGSTAPSGTSPSRVLVEGTVPDNTTPTITDVTINTAQLGQYFQYSDLSAWINEVDVDQNLMARNSENMAQTMDAYYRENICGGTSVGYLADDAGAFGVNQAAVAGRINQVALHKVIRELRNNGALPFKGMIASSDGYGTSAVRESYIGIICPDTTFDLENATLNPAYISSEKYGHTNDIMPGERGALKNVRFIETTQAKRNGNVGSTTVPATVQHGGSPDKVAVVTTLIVAKEAYATVKLGPNSGEIIYIPASQRDKADPLGQYSTLGWKATCGSGILNDSWMKRLEHAVSL